MICTYSGRHYFKKYDSYFNGAGWISSFEIRQRHWDDSADGQSKDAFPLKQMYASWEHPELDLKIVLWLKHDPTEKQVRDVVKVECRLQKKTADRTLSNGVKLHPRIAGGLSKLL